MELMVLGSSSHGNCYLFKAKHGKTLIVEAGIGFRDIKKGLGFDLNGVAGCIVSHRHNDHSASVCDLARSGIHVMAHEDVLSSHGLLGDHFCHKIEPMHGFMVGDFKVYPFPVNHDVPCLGFVISHQEMGKTLFVTDTMMLEYRFSGLDHIMLEANYADDILEENIKAGIVHPSMRERLLGTHMELSTTKGILQANDLSKTHEIVLMHLSGENSNAVQFCNEIKSATGLPTYVARKGIRLTLDKFF